MLASVEIESGMDFMNRNRIVLDNLAQPETDACPAIDTFPKRKSQPFPSLDFTTHEVRFSDPSHFRRRSPNDADGRRWRVSPTLFAASRDAWDKGFSTRPWPRAAAWRRISNAGCICTCTRANRGSLPIEYGSRRAKLSLHGFTRRKTMAAKQSQASSVH